MLVYYNAKIRLFEHLILSLIFFSQNFFLILFILLNFAID